MAGSGEFLCFTSPTLTILTHGFGHFSSASSFTTWSLKFPKLLKVLDAFTYWELSFQILWVPTTVSAKNFPGQLDVFVFWVSFQPFHDPSLPGLTRAAPYLASFGMHRQTSLWFHLENDGGHREVFNVKSTLIGTRMIPPVHLLCSFDAEQMCVRVGGVWQNVQLQPFWIPRQKDSPKITQAAAPKRGIEFLLQGKCCTAYNIADDELLSSFHNPLKQKDLFLKRNVMGYLFSFCGWVA